MKADVSPVEIKSSDLRPKLCTVCEYCKWPCALCKRRLGVTEEWAAKFLGFTSWREVNPSNKKDREYMLNAAIKAHNEDARKKGGWLTPTTNYWLQLAKHVLLTA